MKKQHASYFLSLLIALLIIACHDDTIIDDKSPVKPHTTSVQFQSTELAMAENNKDYIIKLPFTVKPVKAGEITISFTSAKIKFDLNPGIVDGKLRLPFVTNDDAVQFTITPEDNLIINENAVAEFTIVQTSEGILIGNKKTLRLTITDNEIPATANFSIDKTTTKETNASGIEVTILLSSPAPGQGTLKIASQSDVLMYNRNYTTQPVSENGTLSLSVKEGDTKLSFRIIPTDDALFNGSRDLKLTLSAEGTVSRGLNKEHTITITDDELASKPKGYSSGDGLWSVKREYIYDEVTGRVKEVHWEQNTPGTLKGVEQYQYDNAGRLIGMKLNAVDQVVFTWENNRIVRKERFRENVLREYSTYGYDQAGNIGEVANFYVQKDGSIPMTFLFVYLYHNDGNVYKQLTYQPVKEEGKEDDYILISTKTYDNYINVENPFTMVDILPNVKSQPKLATTYRLETNESNQVYEMSYEFDGDGKPISRTSRSGNTSEKVNYFYY